MREYKDRKNAQKKAYYTDRFYVVPSIAKEDVSSDETFAEDTKKLKEQFDIKEAYIQRGQLVIIIKPEDNKQILSFLKNELEYTFLSELSANDYLADSGEFEIFYQLLSMSKRKRLRVKCRIKEKSAIESVYTIFKSADWAEREMFDLVGVNVNNHYNLKRLIMPDDWVGHPLRKAYPLQGDEAASWYEIDKIFGKEYRDIVGPEQRDPARVDKKDTKNFARIHHEVGYGEKPSENKTTQEYQEEDGVFFIDEFKKSNSKVLNTRR